MEDDVIYAFSSLPWLTVRILLNSSGIGGDCYRLVLKTQLGNFHAFVIAGPNIYILLL